MYTTHAINIVYYVVRDTLTSMNDDDGYVEVSTETLAMNQMIPHDCPYKVTDCMCFVVIQSYIS
jgi:hypothetical protein